MLRAKLTFQKKMLSPSSAARNKPSKKPNGSLLMNYVALHAKI
jgi:hypothetical protein